MKEPHLTSKELAKRWSVTSYTIRFWRITGKGPEFLKLNGRVVYKIEEVELFEKKKLRAHTSDLRAHA
jgi:hypothetical protein